MTEEYERYKAAQAARWLEHVAKVGRRLRALQDEIDAQRASAEGVQAVSYDGMPRSQSDGQALPNAVAMLQELVADYLIEAAEYAEVQREAHECLRKIDDPACSECLTRHYLLGASWEQCCVKMGYAYDGMMKLRRRALADAYDFMPTEWRDPMHRAT